MSTGPQIARTVDGYADVLEALSRRAERNTVAMLRQSLDRIMGDLRRAYADLTRLPPPSGSFLSDDLPFPRGTPGAYTLGETTAKYRAISEYAAGFMPEETILGWQRDFNQMLIEATNTGGQAAATIQAIITQAPAAAPFVGANPLAVKAASEIATSFIRGESAAFRDSIAQIVGEGVSRGWGPKRLEKAVRMALEGTSTTQGTTRRVGGPARRAALIARNELANAYGKGAIDHNREQGVEYVRNIAARDELVCPICLSRHGQVYRLDEWMKWHVNCRCTPGPVPSAAVEETDEGLRVELADDEYWQASRERGVVKFMREHKLNREEAEAKLKAAFAKPSPAERWLFPDRKTPTAPVAGP